MRTAFRLPILALLLIGWLAPFAPAAEPMWVAERSSTKVYLIGSVHVLPRSISPGRPALIRAFNDSKRVYFEVALKPGADRGLSEVFKRHGTYKAPDRLDLHLSEDAKDMVQLVLPMFNLRWQDVQDHKPWLLAARLQQSLLHGAGITAAHGVDDYFEALARKKRKPIGGLETADFQLGSFTGLSDAEQSAALVQDIEGLVRIRRDLELMGRMWQAGNAEFFENSTASFQQTKAGKRLFRDRNLKWLPQVARMIHGKENVMVIVGMGHLVGSDGLVTMLRRQGYSVRQM